MDKALHNWKELNAFLRKASEEDCRKVMEMERASEKPRVAFLLRLHGRFNVLRAERERNELMIPQQGRRRGKTDRS